MSRWFIPPIVVPLALLLFVGIVMLVQGQG